MITAPLTAALAYLFKDQRLRRLVKASGSFFLTTNIREENNKRGGAEQEQQEEKPTRHSVPEWFYSLNKLDSTQA